MTHDFKTCGRNCNPHHCQCLRQVDNMLFQANIDSLYESYIAKENEAYIESLRVPDLHVQEEWPMDLTELVGHHPLGCDCEQCKFIWGIIPTPEEEYGIQS